MPSDGSQWRPTREAPRETTRRAVRARVTRQLYCTQVSDDSTAAEDTGALRSTGLR